MIADRSRPKMLVLRAMVGKCGNPVEAVEDDEEDQAEVLHPEGEGEQQQRQPAQPVVPEEQPPAVHPIRKPAGDGGPHHVEDADQSKHAGGGHLGDSMVDGGLLRWVPTSPLVLAPQMKQRLG